MKILKEHKPKMNYMKNIYFILSIADIGLMGILLNFKKYA